MLDEKIEFGDMSRDMKGINIGISMNDKNKNILLKKVVIPEVKTKVLRLNHMCQDRDSSFQMMDRIN